MENRRTFIKKTAIGTTGISMGLSAVSAGESLEFNGEFEKFIDNQEANMLLSRNYRHPYIVPEVV